MMLTHLPALGAAAERESWKKSFALLGHFLRAPLQFASRASRPERTKRAPMERLFSFVRFVLQSRHFFVAQRFCGKSLKFETKTKQTETSLGLRLRFPSAPHPTPGGGDPAYSAPHCLCKRITSCAWCGARTHRKLGLAIAEQASERNGATNK